MCLCHRGSAEGNLLLEELTDLQGRHDALREALRRLADDSNE